MELTDDQDSLACLLGGQGMTTRLDEWRDLLTSKLLEKTATSGGVSLSMRGGPTLESEFQRLIARETGCCAWITWTVRGGSELQVEVTAQQPAGVRLLREWFGAAPEDVSAGAPRGDGDSVA